MKNYSLNSSSSVSHNSETEDWNLRLGQEKDFFLELTTGIEAEFLDRGQSLSHLTDELNEIQRKCLNLSEPSFLEKQASAIQFAFELLKKSEDLVQACYDEYEQVFSIFRELQSRLPHLSRQHAGIMGVVLPLKIIAIGFQSEASRHPLDIQRIYTTLAGNIKGMINEVSSSMGRQFEAFEASEKVAQELMEKVYESIREQKIQVAASLASNRENLRFLNEAMADAGAKAQELSAQNGAVTRHIGEIVMAQQCQDITRQKIEHISQAMDEMRVQLEKASLNPTESELNHRIISASAHIQIQQVRNVYDQLHQAADGLVSGIHGLRTESGLATDSAMKAGGRALDAKIAITQCQKGIGLILGIVERAVHRITDILTLLKPMHTQSVDCTGRATNLAIDLRLSAINAQIFAIQVPEGATLEALAGRMRLISNETLEEVSSMGLGLSHVIELIKNLELRLSDFKAIGEMEQEILKVESEASQKTLLEVEDIVPNFVKQITDRQKNFALSIETVLNKVKFPATVELAQHRSIAFFRSLITWGNKAGEGQPYGEGQMDLLNTNYTMESERRAHAQALGQIFEADPISASSEEELGNNVELF